MSERLLQSDFDPMRYLTVIGCTPVRAAVAARVLGWPDESHSNGGIEQEFSDIRGDGGWSLTQESARKHMLKMQAAGFVIAAEPVSGRGGVTKPFRTNPNVATPDYLAACGVTLETARGEDLPIDFLGRAASPGLDRGPAVRYRALKTLVERGEEMDYEELIRSSITVSANVARARRTLYGLAEVSIIHISRRYKTTSRVRLEDNVSASVQKMVSRFAAISDPKRADEVEALRQRARDFVDPQRPTSSELLPPLLDRCAEDTRPIEEIHDRVLEVVIRDRTVSPAQIAQALRGPGINIRRHPRTISQDLQELERQGRLPEGTKLRTGAHWPPRLSHE